MTRRRALMARVESEPGELYPVGTNIVANIIFTPNTSLDNNGDIITNNNVAAESDYIPVNPNYTYERLNRIYAMCSYDANKNFVGTKYVSNTVGTYVLPSSAIDSRAKYIRVATHTAYLNRDNTAAEGAFYIKRVS